jgi:PAS domain S-box-containing protein
MKNLRRARLRLARLGFSAKGAARLRVMRGKGNMLWFVAALLLQCGIAASTYVNIQRSVASANWASRSPNILLTLEGLRSKSERADSCLRNYAQYQDDARLRCIYDSAARIPKDLAQLHQLTQDDLLAQQKVAELEPLLLAETDSLKKAILPQNIHDKRVEQLSLLAQERENQGQVRLLIGNLEAREQSLLAERLTGRRAASLRSVAILGAGTMISTGILCVVFLIHRRDIKKRVSAQYFMRLAYAGLEFAHRQLDGIFESTPDSIAAVDRELHWIAFNGKYKMEFRERHSATPEAGSSLEEVLGSQPEDLVRSSEVWQRALRGEAFTLMEEFGDPAHGKKFYEVRYFPIADRRGVPLAACRIARDITERKHFENLLFRQSEELARSNAELEQFAYVASHDLQEPLRMVSSYMQLLAERYQGKLDARADKYVGYAVDGAQRMQALISDLLALSRVNSQGGEYRPVGCDTVLQRVLHDLEAAIGESGAVLEGCGLPVVMADEGQLYQLFQNLVGNALKFRSEKPLRIQIKAVPQAGLWLFTVRDNGIGIAPEHAERIFVLFQRLHSRQQYSGTGLGLAISKKIVQRHGGSIWVESEVGQGATFKFTLPMSDQDQNQNKFDGQEVREYA